MVRCKKIALCPLRFLVNFKWFLFIYTLFYSYNRKFLTKVGFSVKKYITKKYWNKVVNVLLYYRREFLSYFIYLSLFKNLEKLFLLFCYVGYKGNSLNYSFFLFYPKNHKNLEFWPKQAQNKFETVPASIKHINFNHWSRDHTCLIDKTNKNQSHMTDKILLLLPNA